MPLIVDASVACKWYLLEEGRLPAMALLTRGESLLAPDLIFAEVGNVLWKHCQQNQLTQAQLEQIANHLSGAIEHAVSCRELFIDAVELAARLKHPIYDCYYLALARRESLPFITADRRLLDTLKGQEWGGKALSLHQLGH